MSLRLILSLLACLASLVASNPVTLLAAGITSQDVAAGLGIVVDVDFLDTNRTLVAVKNGQIRLVKNGVLQPGNFLDLTSKVGTAFGDRGLLTLTVDPQFPTNPYIYVGYVLDTIPSQPTACKTNRISRFTVVGDTVNLASELILLGNCNNLANGWYGGDCSPNPGTTHSVDSVWFGPDGALYASIGDGQTQEGADWNGKGCFNIPTSWALAMDPTYLGGKVIRIDPTTGAGFADNPFYDGNVQSSASRVWSVGHRNPWRCGHAPSSVSRQAKVANIDPTIAASTPIICGNVGWYTSEQLSLVTRGSNLGWPCYEGRDIPPWYNPQTPACTKFYQGNTTAPPFVASSVAYQYPHNGLSAAVIGGVWIPSWFPKAVAGQYLFADFVTGEMFTLPWDAQAQKVPANAVAAKFAINSDSPVGFKVGPDGLIYYVSQCIGCSRLGSLRRLVPNGWTGKPGGTTTTTSTVSKSLSTTSTTSTTIAPIVTTTTQVVGPSMVPITTWTCLPGFLTPVRMNAVTNNTQCMTADNKNCLWTTTASQCQALAAAPPQGATGFECGAQHLAQWGITGYGPGTWCSAGLDSLWVAVVPTSTAPMTTTQVAPTQTALPITAWTCLTGFLTPVRLNPATNNTQCMTTDNKNCLWTTTASQCQALAATPPQGATGFECGAQHLAQWGITGYGPGTWCSAGKDQLWTIQRIQPTVTATTTGAPTQSLVPITTWSCVPGFNLPLRVAPSGDTACMSTDGKNCIWAVSPESCVALANNPPANVGSFACGTQYNAVYGGDGYGSGTWCTAGKNSLWISGNGCGQVAGISANGWTCVPGITTPVKLVGNDAACMSLDGKNCLWGATDTDCVNTIRQANAATAGSFSCGGQYQSVYGFTGYGQGTWCTNGLQALKPVCPSSTTTRLLTTTTTRTTTTSTTVNTCLPANPVNIPPLPAGWDTIMYLGTFPGVKFLNNGNWGPVEIDASVGGKAAFDGRQITIGGVRYSKGVGMRQTGNISVPISKYCYRFVADVGIDDESKGVGAAEFVVRNGIGATLWNSTRARNNVFIKAGDLPFGVDLRNLQTLDTLNLWSLRPWANTIPTSLYPQTSVDWGMARLFCGPDAPYLPTVSIISPVRTKTFAIDETINFSGQAFDFKGQAIDPSNFMWMINLIHCQGPLCHTHFVVQLPGVATGSFVASDHPLAAAQYFYYEIRLLVTDNCGRSNFATRNLTPTPIKASL